MSDVLVRGLPRTVHHRIQRYADSRSLSVNQLLVQLITKASTQLDREVEMEERRKEAFRRIDERREMLYQKYGLFEDSTRLIREDRESH